MPVKTDTNTTETSTALVKWDEEKAQLVEQLIVAGKSVPKALVLASPKGFVSKVRADRRAFVSQNHDRLLGEITQKGYRLVDIRAPKMNERTGDERMSVTFMKRGDVMVEVKRMAAERGLTIEQLRVAINAV